MKNTIINKKGVFIFLFVLMNITGWALLQSQKDDVKINRFTYTPIDSNYRFIKYRLNHIFTPDSSTLHHFFSKLDSLQNGNINKVNILHIGDSHIQADLLTDKLRRNFQNDSALGNGGYGLAFPYSIAKSNNPTWYKSSYSGNWETCRMNLSSKSCDWGIAGINASTADVNASFEINLCAFKSRCYEFNKVRFFCNTNDSTQFTPTISTSDLSNDVLVESVKIDTANQIIEYLLSKAISKARFGFVKTANSQSKFTLKGISLENTSQKGIVYHSIGLNSATAYTFLKNDFPTQVKKVKPDLIIISLGTNDAYSKYFNETNFYNSFSSLIKKLQESYPQASILLTSPGDSYRKRRYPNLNFTKTPAIFKQLAKDNNCAFWNMHQVMGGYKSINKWYIKQLCQKDKLHFTRSGYELQADLLFDALMKKYSSKY